MRPAALSIDSVKSKNGTPDRSRSPLSAGVVKTMLAELLLELIDDSTKSKDKAERLMAKKSSTYLARKMMSDDRLEPLSRPELQFLPLAEVRVERQHTEDGFHGRPKSTHTGRMADHTKQLATYTEMQAPMATPLVWW
jgi:hypothetical protein